MRLLVLRHAKTERAAASGRDVDRPLAPRGRGDAQRLGAFLARHGFVPDLALVSSAERTRQTWSGIAAAFDPVPEAAFESELYDASPETMLALVRRTPAGVGTLMLVGHNPTVHQFALQLAAGGDLDARQRLGESFPTSGAALISFAGTDWSAIRRDGGRLEHFLTPATLTDPA